MPRRGWVDKAGIESPESVADHTYMTTLMAMVFGDLLGLDTSKLMKLAILHDLAEHITGDIMPGEMSKDEKVMMEHDSMLNILGRLPRLHRRRLYDEYVKLWNEYTANTSPESQLVHEIDKLEMALQAMLYSEQFQKASFDGFFESANSAIKNKRLRRVFDDITEHTWWRDEVTERARWREDDC